MADSRILHRAAGDSEKVAALSDLEYRVWTQYLLSADDFGVMPATAFVLQAENRSFRKRPTKTIQKALEAVIAVGLVLTFTHQGERYAWQPDWNDRQQIRYPRATVRPLPEDWTLATEATVKLFRLRTEKSPKDSGEVSEMSPIPAGAGTRETLTHTQTLTQAQTQTPEGSVRETARQRYGPPIVGGPLEHRAHGWCNDRGLCLTAGLYAELLNRLGRHRQDEFRAWLGATIDGLGDNVPGENIFTFWRSRFEAWQGNTAPSTKGARTIAAGNRVSAKLAAGAEIDPFGTKADAREAAKQLADKASA